MIPIGDPVGEVSFLTADGASFRLADLAGRKVLLIFLRHLA